MNAFSLKIDECLDKLSHVSESSVSLDVTPHIPSLVCVLVFSADGRSSRQVGRSTLCWI